MKPSEWSNSTDPDTVCRRAGGRRRYNAQRRRLAQARRKVLDRILTPEAMLFPRGLTASLARAFGVSRQTAWRDLRAVVFGPCQTNYSTADGKLLFSVYRAYPGGPVVRVTDARGNEIRGAERRGILRRLSRQHA